MSYNSEFLIRNKFCRVLFYKGAININVWNYYAVAFKLYDMDGTGFIERHEVRILGFVLRCCYELAVNEFRPVMHWKYVCFSLELLETNVESRVIDCQVKQMLIALLFESELKLADETIETILDKVNKLHPKTLTQTSKNPNAFFFAMV